MQGDSGGPLNGPNDDNTIYGLTSWGWSGCPAAAPSAYAKTGAFRDWICANAPDAEGC